VKRLLVLALCLACALRPDAARAQAGETDSDWVSYRDAYRAMIWFEKYAKPKQFLQNHYRVRPKDKGASLDGLRLTLESRSLRVNLPLDGVGRVVFPFSKAAFDDNGELTVNRKAARYRFSPWVSIVSRPDGVYQTSDLRLACEQLLAYLQYVGDAYASDKKCVGVQFAYAKNEADPEVRLRRPERAPVLLPVKEDGAFQGESAMTFKVVQFQFADWPDKGQVVTRGAPIAIATLLE